jgi:hypothetical protein
MHSIAPPRFEQGFRIEDHPNKKYCDNFHIIIYNQQDI